MQGIVSVHVPLCTSRMLLPLGGIPSAKEYVVRFGPHRRAHAHTHTRTHNKIKCIIPKSLAIIKKGVLTVQSKCPLPPHICANAIEERPLAHWKWLYSQRRWIITSQHVCPPPRVFSSNEHDCYGHFSCSIVHWLNLIFLFYYVISYLILFYGKNQFFQYKKRLNC